MILFKNSILIIIGLLSNIMSFLKLASKPPPIKQNEEELKFFILIGSTLKSYNIFHNSKTLCIFLKFLSFSSILFIL